jgi:FdhD protein
VTADIILKGWRAGIPLIASRALPTLEAVELAHAAGVTLIGRVLDQRRTIYTHVWRLTPADEIE